MRTRSSASSAREDADEPGDSLPAVAAAVSDAAADHQRDLGRSNLPTHRTSAQLDRRKSTSQHATVTRISPPKDPWTPAAAAAAAVAASNVAVETDAGLPPTVSSTTSPEAAPSDTTPNARMHLRRSSTRSPWSVSLLTLAATALAIWMVAAIVFSLNRLQCDSKGCRMSYMMPGYAKLRDFDTEHTRFASKYSVYLYRESYVDEDTKVKGVPVLFIPGNAGSYRQVRPIASEGAKYFHDVLRHDPSLLNAGVRTLDFFTVDFNEDITAFHGQTLLDQAEYLNDAVAYILSLYHDPRRSARDPDLPDPTSVIILGHSMGGIVARTMLVMPNYQSNSINTIITMSAPHARPPVSFDPEIVDTYNKINTYWREAYSQKWANNNPLWHVTLISIAGGALDTVVPSDYASLDSLAPETHGFTVFTTTIPSVWTGMDHQAILWCEQFRKVVVKALYDVVDVNRPAQTKPRAERMRTFKRWFLTGMERIAERSLPRQEPTTLLTLEDNSNSIIAQGERLVLRSLGQSKKPKAYLLPVPPLGTPGGRRFTLLTDQKLDRPGEKGHLEVLFCSVFPLHPGQSSAVFSMNMDLSGDSSGSTRLACKSAATDVMLLPASTLATRQPFWLEGEEPVEPFSYLQYDLEDIADHQFVAVVDKAQNPTAGWALAEFSDNVQSQRALSVSPRTLLAFGTDFSLPADRPLVSELKIPAIASSLLTYKLDLGPQACETGAQLFMPLVRQYLSEPYESKFFVNARTVDINLHGVAPYMPPPLRARQDADGLTLQFWADPTCNSTIHGSIRLDMLGSFGKLYIRYRTVLAAFPLLVVAFVLRKQFRMYDDTGVFISFSDALDASLRQSLPLAMLALSMLAVSYSTKTEPSTPQKAGWRPWSGNGTETAIDFTKNDLLLGSSEPFFWFLVPLTVVLCVGVCVLINYAALALIEVLCVAYGMLKTRAPWIPIDDKRRRAYNVFTPTPPQRRVVITAILLILVATLIPYQFAYLVACLVQLATCVRARRVARDTRTSASYSFYNYVHSIFVLMLWILPINLPILVVWVHNLAVHWFTPFSSHHNVLSITPFILLVETLTSGKMVPRMTSRLRHVTNVLFFGIAIYAAIYGVTYAYMLHHLVNLVATWLVAVHASGNSWDIAGITSLFGGEPSESRKRGKTP